MAPVTSAFAVGQIAGPTCVRDLVGPDANLSSGLPRSRRWAGALKRLSTFIACSMLQRL